MVGEDVSVTFKAKLPWVPVSIDWGSRGILDKHPKESLSEALLLKKKSGFRMVQLVSTKVPKRSESPEMRGGSRGRSWVGWERGRGYWESKPVLQC